MPLIILEFPELAGDTPRPRGTFPENQTELDQVLADDIAAGASADFELPPDVIDEARARARAANYGRGRFTALVSRTSAHRRIHLGASIEVVLARRPNTITACDVQQVVGPGVVRVQVADGPRRGLVLDLSLGEVWPWDRLVSAL